MAIFNSYATNYQRLIPPNLGTGDVLVTRQALALRLRCEETKTDGGPKRSREEGN